MKISELLGKKVVLVGYGVEGRATETFLKKHLPGVSIGVADKAQDAHYLENLSEYDIAIKSPGIPGHLIPIPYTTATNLFFGEVQGKVIGVTGTKGKSTTTSLIYHILKQAGLPAHIAGNIGVPMLELLEHHNSPDYIFVLELSSYMLADIDASPDISVVVSLYPDHLDYHGTLEKYYEAKHRIIAHTSTDDIFVYNPAFPELEQWAQSAHCRTRSYIHKIPAEVNTIPLLGEHNRDNIRAALTVTYEFGIDINTIATAIASFQPLRHRLQKVGTFQEITFYDDAISTTPESTIQALHAVPNIGALMLGGLDRGYDFTPLITELQQLTIPVLIFFPDSGAKILGMLKDAGKTAEHILETSNMEDAVRFVYQYCPKGSACLLSSASPSYSLWKNFEEKGDQFQHWVRYYATNNTKTSQENIKHEARVNR
jgi:UDP-N-acetylmuramoylalanine--D-glutamate ligase